MSGRLASAVIAGGLLRTAEAAGGFGMVLEKGDATAGSILVILLERGGNPRVLERILSGDGGYRWQDMEGQNIEVVGEVPAFVARRRQFDPDLWVLELDIPSQERFAAEMNSPS